MKHLVINLKYCAQSDIELVRLCNEDAYLVGGGQSDAYPGSLYTCTPPGAPPPHSGG